MAIASKSTMRLSADELFPIFGELEFKGMNEPYQNDKTGEYTTKVKVLSEKMEDFYEITVKGKYSVDELGWQKNDVLKFTGCELSFVSSGRQQFGNIASTVQMTIKADEVVNQTRSATRPAVSGDEKKDTNKQPK